MIKITLNVIEAAELVGVSTATIYKMAREEQIPHIKIRSRILFHREVIENWLRSQSSEIKELSIQGGGGRG
ncbi:helix-turn-helix domain-containing protein [Paenibacillus sp. GM2]|uniref:helix-turn-helix domain-containing protein n=1 Tax=Paenibacillus sp. GM2 TaxID=1622070 RepID=UPI0008390920|nr:helix-turn-helix domain-containing protein [Paenibacillus sp. GM2]